MKAPRRRDLEQNELGWWSNWAKLRWVGKDAYLMTSSDLPEVFFNKGGVISCSVSNAPIDKLEGGLAGSGRPPAIMVYEACTNVVKALEKRGYVKADLMIVMAAEREVVPQEADVKVAGALSVTEWARAYLLAFYGELGLLDVTKEMVGRASRSSATTLLEARIEGEVAGVLALFRTRGLMGVYCVGTVPKHRRRGVSGALLSQAWRTAASEKRTLFLQTLESDGVKDFYVKRGFAALYSKALMNKGY